jgi:hypothetical protein
MTFNVQDFLNQTVSESNSTEIEQVPPGTYQACLEKIEAKQYPRKDDPSKVSFKCELQWSILDDAVLSDLERDKVIVRQDFFLDINESGRISTERGKNVSLGRLRVALGLNDTGQVFSLNDAVGRCAQVLVKQDLYKDKMYSKVYEVSKI